MKRRASEHFVIARVSRAAPGPLYQQIIDGIRREISEGRLESGTPLPSFRVLAEDLLVSLITVKRAYEELERDGVICRKQGLGTFVSENGAARSRNLKRERAEMLLRQALQEGAEAGLGADELLATVKKLLQEKET